MFLRIATSTPPAWQIGLAVGIVVITTFLLAGLSAKIYRIGLLMFGKRLTIPEILHWSRYR